MSLAEAPESSFEQKQTRGVRSTIPLDLIILPPKGEAKPIEDLRGSNDVLLRAQQIIFLPHFNTTDYIFHGEYIDSEDPNDGFPTIRTAMVRGSNFYLFLHQNFNLRSDVLTQIHLSYKDPEDDQSMSIQIDASNGDTDPQTAIWLLDEVLTPVMNELLAQDPHPVPDYLME